MNQHLHDSSIDLVVLSRDDSPLHPDVQRGIASQTDVRLIVHRVFGKRLEAESSRLPAIVRARNEGKRLGNRPWLMFLDDDVVLAPNTTKQLLDGLRARQGFAALAADYRDESRGIVASEHVGMGAVLFRRSALDLIEFRWSPSKCECLCCCQDLRRKGMGIGYLPDARARHISLGDPSEHARTDVNADRTSDLAHSSTQNGNRTAYILAAFDRNHRRRFQHRFLSSLRAAGNQEPVIALAYGLYPSECRQLQQLPGVRLISIPSNGVDVPIRRLLDFQGPLKRLPSTAVVAYWDAGDVIFQDRLTDLWALASETPGRLLVVAEPLRHPQNKAVAQWTLSIHHPDARRRAFELLSTRPVLNGGFAAGTAETMLRYLQAAHELRHSIALYGTTDWGDQTAMNLYCHTDPSRFLEVDDRWNYCICGRESKDCQLLAGGRFTRQDARAISVVHGNGASLVPYAFSAPMALARSSATTKYLF